MGQFRKNCPPMIVELKGRFAIMRIHLMKELEDIVVITEKMLTKYGRLG